MSMSRAVYVLESGHSRRRDHFQRHRDDEKDCREMQTLLVMAGISFFILIVIVLSKFEVRRFTKKLKDREFDIQMSSEHVMNYAPMLWLIGVIIIAVAFNSFHFYKERRTAKRLNRMNVEALLSEMALPQSFPCLLPGPHDECCGGRGIISRPLPAYDELSIDDETISKFDTSTSPPPDYLTAVEMLRQNDK